MSHRTHLSFAAAIIMAVTVIAIPGTAWAANLQASSTAPIVSFDDTSQADGSEWYIWGTDEIFAVNDVAAQTTVINYRKDLDSVTLGPRATATGIVSLALGYEANAMTSSGTAIGHIATAEGVNSLAVGYGAWSFGQQAAAFGMNASAFGNYSTALGNGASVSAAYGVAQGTTALASGQYAVATGANTIAEGLASMAQGSGAVALGERSMAIGSSTSAGGKYGVALGYRATSDLDYSIALGNDASALHTNSVALGSFAHSSGSRSVAVGYLAKASALQSIALGTLAVADNPDTVILGAVAGKNTATVSANVGIGTTDPLAPLHVARDDGTAGILVSEADLATGPRTLFEIENNGNPEFRMTNTANGNSWAFSAGLRFVVKNNLGDWVMRVTDTGNLEIGGTLMEMSDRNRKHAIVPLDGDTVLAKLAQVPVSEWAYDDESADQRHIGPMAQDFHAAFGLASGEKAISARDMAGVNMAAVQALNRRLERENADIRAELDALKAQVMALRDSLPMTTQAVARR